MKDNFFPEDRLLKLIKQDKNKPLAGQNAAITQTRAQKTESAKEILQTAAHSPAGSLGISLRTVILIFFFASCIFLLGSILYPAFFLKNISLPKPQNITLQPSNTAAKERLPYESYEQAVASHQIFGSASAQGLEAPENAKSSDPIKDLTLIGIMAGDNPQVIIEDKKTQKTYYLNKGQFVGEFKVEDIQEGKVILVGFNQRFELYL